MKNNLLKIAAHDGYPLEVMFSVPDEGTNKLVLYVNGSGPNTYNIKRQRPDGTFFNYHDFFADEFTRRGIAYCRYSTRGTKDGETAPFFADVDEAQYRTYLPHNSVKDVERIVRYIRSEYRDIRIYLLGWSEGSIIAPLVALNADVEINGLFLCGYCNENLRDTLIWQLNGNHILTIYRRLFDYDRKGYISKQDIEEDRYHVREAMLGSATFEQFDLDGNGILTASDFVPETAGHLNGMLSAIERGDDEWLKNNHGIRLTSEWFREHFELEPNRTVLPRVDIPIHIFSGEYDEMTPRFYAEDIERSFVSLGKTNLTVHYFENHDHDLNYLKYILTNEISDGLACILDTITNFE